MPPFNTSSEEKQQFPYEINDVESETSKKLLQDFTGERTNFVQVGPKKYFFPCKYKEHAQNIYDFHVRPDDVWIVTFPRSGTTWTQEMVWLMANNFDYETAAKVPLLQRVPFFEYSLFVHKDIKRELLELNSKDQEKIDIVMGMDLNMWEEMKKLPGRRFFKTHLPFSLLPSSLLTSGCKIIYVARNPKDVAVSYYHLNRLMITQGYRNDWPTYFDYFTSNLQAWAPYWEHIREGYDLKDHKNVLFMFYEDMTRDVQATLRHLSDFLNLPLDQQQMERLQEHLSIKNFKNNSSVNFDMLDRVGVLIHGEQGFIREGKVGGKAEYYDEETNAKYSKWLKDNERIIGDIKFPLK